MYIGGGQYLEVMEEVGPTIPYFGVGGSVHYDVRDIIQGGGSGGAPVWIRDVDHEPANCQDAGGISPPDGSSSDRKTNAEGCGR